MKERKLREEQEMKERLNKKLEEQSAMNEKMMEAKLREEREKQRLRYRGKTRICSFFLDCLIFL